MAQLPFDLSGASLGRVDQGVDVTTQKDRPYTAVGAGVITRVDPNFYKGTPAVYEHLDQPVKVNGRSYQDVYYSETPLAGNNIVAGARLFSGQPVIQGGSAEIGFAGAGTGLPAAHAVYHEGDVTQAGTDFGAFLHGITNPVGISDNKSAADFWSGKGGSVAIGAGLGVAAASAAAALAAGGVGAAESGAAGAGGGSALTKLLGSTAGKTGAGLTLAFLANKYGDHWLQRGAEMVGGSVLLLLALGMVGFSAVNKVAPAATPVTRTLKAARAPRQARERAATGAQRQQVAAQRSQAREARVGELHAARVSTEKARATNIRSQSRARSTAARQTKAQRDAAEKRAYYRGAADAGR